jgi:hypothetical protein
VLHVQDDSKRARGRKKQERQQAKPGSKQELGLAWEFLEFGFSCETERVAASDSEADARREEPPKPRPRKLFSNSV